MNNVIFKNTIVLYVRTFITMIIAFYTSRVILDVLGIIDFGIYNLVAGIVLVFQSLSTTLAGASQRYITFSLGKDNGVEVEKVFSVVKRIHGYLSVLVIFLGETVGLWFINTQLNIDGGRMLAANIAYQSALLIFVVDIVNLPLGALMISYEEMGIYAFIYIFQSLLRLLCVFVLSWVSYDKLILYSLLEVGVALFVRFLFVYYCKKHYPVCCAPARKDYALQKEIAAFAGWNFFGTTANVAYEQGANILLNIFYSVVLNAARGITNQVSRAVSVFVSNFTVALNPQITKCCARGDYKEASNLVCKGCKLAFYLMMVVAVPFLLNTSYILNLWLTKIPDYTVIFIQLAVIAAVIDSYVKPFHCALFATGNIALYQIIVSLFSLSRLAILWLLFIIGEAPYWVYVIIILFNLTHVFLLVVLVSKRIYLKFMCFVREVLMPTFIVLLFSIVFVFFVHHERQNFIGFMTESTLSLIFLSIIIFLFGLNYNEKLVMIKKATQIIGRL